MSFTHKPYPVLHAGVAGDGRIVVSHGDGKAWFLEDGAPSDELKARAVKMLRVDLKSWACGATGAWLRVPGRPEHSVVGRLADGSTVTADMAAWVFNDATLVDEICGPGTYERVMPAEEVQILQLARPLYRAVAS